MIKSLQDLLFNQLKDQMYVLCKDLYGCRVIQCILTNGSVIHKNVIFEAVIQAPMDFTTDRYGNYVVQHVISSYILFYLFFFRQEFENRYKFMQKKHYFAESCAPQQVNGLSEFILGQIVVLSQQKYASNVVEKCLSTATDQKKQETLGILCERPPEYVSFLIVKRYLEHFVWYLEYS